MGGRRPETLTPACPCPPDFSSHVNGDEEPRWTFSLPDELYSRGGHARTVGVTGPPGSGKSTLISALARAARQRGQTVAILSVDPGAPIHWRRDFGRPHPHA